MEEENQADAERGSQAAHDGERSAISGSALVPDLGMEKDDWSHLLALGKAIKKWLIGTKSGRGILIALIVSGLVYMLSIPQRITEIVQVQISNIYEPHRYLNDAAAFSRSGLTNEALSAYRKAYDATNNTKMQESIKVNVAIGMATLLGDVIDNIPESELDNLSIELRRLSNAPPESWYGLARYYLWHGNTTKAADSAERAIRIARTRKREQFASYVKWMILAPIYLINDDIEKAVKIYTETIWGDAQQPGSASNILMTTFSDTKEEESLGAIYDVWDVQWRKFIDELYIRKLNCRDFGEPDIWTMERLDPMLAWVRIKRVCVDRRGGLSTLFGIAKDWPVLEDNPSESTIRH